MGGWVKIHKSIVDHEVFRNPNRLQVWIYILANAAHQDFGKKRGVRLKRGQLTVNCRSLGEALGMPKSTVYDALKWLEGSDEVRTQPGREFTLVSVVNWDTYQVEEEGPGRSSDEVRTFKRSKDLKPKISCPNSVEFDEFWTAYPRKESKGTARRAFKTALKKTDSDTILTGLKQQLPDLKAREKKYIPLPATWLNGERWGDETKPTRNTEKPRILT